MTRRLLLLSNSKNYGEGYLEHASDAMRDFLGSIERPAVFLPYAAVTVSFDDYTRWVRESFSRIGCALRSVHEVSDPSTAIAEAGAIVVGGGNTFRLLHHMYQLRIVDVIRQRVDLGVPYIGWSAGSNVACPTIKTTNDMPIILPPTLDALGLVPFQLNPHFLDAHPEGHQGETREQRLQEFIELNPDVNVVGLREGSILRIDGGSIVLLGNLTARLFRRGQPPREYGIKDDLSFLLE